MAADYAFDAVLVRGSERHEGRPAIEAYFATVPERLGAARVIFDEVAEDGATATFRWHLDGASVPASGVDHCRIEAGEIVHQVVHLDGGDF